MNTNMTGFNGFQKSLRPYKCLDKSRLGIGRVEIVQATTFEVV